MAAPQETDAVNLESSQVPSSLGIDDQISPCPSCEAKTELQEVTTRFKREKCSSCGEETTVRGLTKKVRRLKCPSCECEVVKTEVNCHSCGSQTQSEETKAKGDSDDECTTGQCLVGSCVCCLCCPIITLGAVACCLPLCIINCLSRLFCCKSHSHSPFRCPHCEHSVSIASGLKMANPSVMARARKGSKKEKKSGRKISVGSTKSA